MWHLVTQSCRNLYGRKPRTIHNTLLPRDSTSHSTYSCAKKNLATGTAVYVCDYHSNGTWTEGIARALRDGVLYEEDVDGTNFVLGMQKNHGNWERVL
ncbi:unnamed protein product [Hymenolepis diminuta]|uniref:Uncharacterized protein n=1 Tax=Hymenolepis diminuta TaxID=6216 RepID=A0A564YLW2_HYMDI|nr:unnamed protein product [Hymenolepis diminuta]